MRTYCSGPQAHSLGPEARSALRSLLAGKSWADLRGELWGSSSSVDVAVGYKFDIPGRWAEPERIIALDQPFESPRPEMIDIDTRFTDSAGSGCGEHRVRFASILVGRHRFVVDYFVDGSDIGSLLRLIASCAARR